MPGKAVESTLPPGSASRWRCVAALPGGTQAWGNGPMGNRGPVEVEEMLSGRPETCHGQRTEARGHAARSVDSAAAPDAPGRGQGVRPARSVHAPGEVGQAFQPDVGPLRQAGKPDLQHRGSFPWRKQAGGAT